MMIIDEEINGAFKYQIRFLVKLILLVSTGTYNYMPIYLILSFIVQIENPRGKSKDSKRYERTMRQISFVQMHLQERALETKCS